MDIFSNVTFWVWVSTIGFVLLLIKYKVPSMATSMLDDRAAQIKKELDEASALREEAQKLLASYHAKQREAEAEADSIIAQAKEEAALLKAETEKALDEQIERRTKLAEEKIAAAEAQAMNEVKEIATDVAVGAARRLLKDNLDDTRSAALIENSLAEVKSKLH